MERDYISGILSNFLITELSVSMDPRLFQVIGISTSKRLLVYIYIFIPAFVIAPFYATEQKCIGEKRAICTKDSILVYSYRCEK